jgi:FkbM family methyltransferase
MATNDLDRVEPEAWYAKHEFRLLLHRLRGLPAEERARLQGLFTQTLIEQTFDTETPHGPLSFVLLGRMSAGRAATLLTKQPGTIEWIDSFRPNSVFWDVGANVGVYTLYAARRGDIKVAAFEPAAVNYFLLSANVEANNLVDQVDCLLVGLSNRKAMARLQVSQFEPGRSFSFRGKRDPEQISLQAALLVSIDQLVEEYGFACPNYIKIDVPGLTESIIDGGMRTLRRPEVRELHVEMKEHTSTGEHIIERLQKSGFVLSARHTHSNTIDITFSRPGS